MIYLDHAATTPLDERVYQAMLPYLKPDGVYGNPASSHGPGFAAASTVEQARAQVAALIGAEANEIIWTSGATESNNLALKGALEFYEARGRHIVTSAIEHKSVLDPCRYLETRKARVTYLKPDGRGVISAAQVLAALSAETVLVSLMWVNNETGAVNPIEQLAPVLRERGILFHVDAVQAAGKLPIDLSQIPIDLMSLSAHKLAGPKGVGALFVRKRPRARLAPQMHGSGHEQGMRAGTLATHQIVGMGAAYRIAAENLHEHAARMAGLRDQLWQALQVLPGIHLNGALAHRAPHILNVSFEGAEGESLRALLPDLAVSSGSACSSATREPSYVLRALGRNDELAGSSLRFSLSRGTTRDDIEQAAARVIAAVKRLRENFPLPSGEGQGEGALRENVFGYSDPIWQRFSQPQHAGTLEAHETGAVSAQAGSAASKSLLKLSVKLQGETISTARFQAYGCPVTLAVGEWLAEQLSAKPVEALRSVDLSASAIRAALEIPEDRAHVALMGEDAVLALLQQLK